ncbi:MAG: sarcosine oxidase subunit delta [Pseudomonadota bacterium]
MLRITCPFCGERDHSEFSYGSDATIEYPALDASIDEWHDAVFLRDNIRGMQAETWHCTGCRTWIIVERDTMTHEIASVRAAHEGWAKAIADDSASQGGDA